MHLYGRQDLGVSVDLTELMEKWPLIARALLQVFLAGFECLSAKTSVM